MKKYKHFPRHSLLWTLCH